MDNERIPADAYAGIRSNGTIEVYFPSAGKFQVYDLTGKPLHKYHEVLSPEEVLSLVAQGKK